jgi:hypothetical protein
VLIVFPFRADSQVAGVTGYVIFQKLREQGIVIAAAFTVLLHAGCVDRPAGSVGAGKANGRDLRQEEPMPPAQSPVQAKKPAAPKGKPAELAGATQPEQESEKVDWGREATAAEIIAMAKNGEIREIEWHVMPNILRALASDGRIFFVRNENKGMDMRGLLIKAGVQVGNGGVTFRHVF